MRHSNVAPGSDANPNVGNASLLGFDGFVTIAATGGVVSTMHVCAAGVGSTHSKVDGTRSSVGAFSQRVARGDRAPIATVRVTGRAFFLRSCADRADAVRLGK